MSEKDTSFKNEGEYKPDNKATTHHIKICQNPIYPAENKRKGNKISLYLNIFFYFASILLASDPNWKPYRIIPILLTLLVTVGTVMYKKVEK